MHKCEDHKWHKVFESHGAKAIFRCELCDSIGYISGHSAGPPKIVVYLCRDCSVEGKRGAANVRTKFRDQFGQPRLPSTNFCYKHYEMRVEKYAEIEKKKELKIAKQKERRKLSSQKRPS